MGFPQIMVVVMTVALIVIRSLGMPLPYFTTAILRPQEVSQRQASELSFDDLECPLPGQNPAVFLQNI